MDSTSITLYSPIHQVQGLQETNGAPDYSYSRENKILIITSVVFFCNRTCGVSNTTSQHAR